MKTFEYKTVPFHQMTKGHYQELDVDKLNELGNEGWQFVTVVSGECLFQRETRKRVVRPC
ncbi:DUF4177 domain-containing protein [Bacillus sp. M6-12]|uniref:DUF4177 domain-containing protein n=1 Tax=Bacillus sp. M6-12 TaxID=2054166 RepID=UPI000C759861|nr:DUF4177 domain-containing protein [Bacillus sp. M6-12]PLS18984.1 DUF4177 domain-containing protein [Bacillus sp. M6-12]